MKKSLEKQLREAGATEEQIRDLDRMLDADKKRMKRRKEARKKHPFSKGDDESTESTDSDRKYELTYVFFSELDYVDADGNERPYEPVDEKANVEAAAENDFLLEELKQHLGELPPDDVAFLYEFFAVREKKTVEEIAGMFEMKVWEIYERRDRLIRKLKEMFEEN